MTNDDTVPEWTSSHDKHSEFHLEEYRALRSEIEGHTREIRVTERLALGAIVVIYSWLFVNENQSEISVIAWAVPPLIAVLGGIKSFAIMQRIDELAEYTKELEVHFRHESLMGWEHRLKELRERPEAKSQRTISLVFWVVTAGTALSILLFKIISHYMSMPGIGE